MEERGHLGSQRRTAAHDEAQPRAQPRAQGGQHESIGDAMAARAGDSAWGFALAVLGAVLVAAVVGALIEALILKRLYAAPELLQLTATFAIVLIVRDGKGVMVDWRYADGKDYLPSDDTVRRLRPAK